MKDEWPHAFERRRVPTQSIHGPTDAASAQLQILLLLDEIERQSRGFTTSYGAAIDAALGDGDSEACWHNLQSALFCAIIVNRLLYPQSNQRGWPGVRSVDARRLAQERAASLRSALHIPGPAVASTAIDQVRRFRDAMEHVDERLDRAIHDPKIAAVTDWYLSDGFVISPDGDADGPALRAFVPETGLLVIGSQGLDTFALDLEMIGLQINLNHARAEIVEKTPRGRNLHSGGGRVRQVMPHTAQARIDLARWKAKRANMLDETLRTAIGGNKLWLEFDNPTE